MTDFEAIDDEATKDRMEPRAAEVGDFAQTMLLELRQMARRSGCAYLAYLLELSMIEASDLAAGRPPSPVAPVSVAPAERPDFEEVLRRIMAA